MPNTLQDSWPTDNVSATIYNQTKIWKTKDGRVLLITKMDPNHRKNTIAFLKRNAERIASKVWVVEAFGPTAWGNPDEMPDGIFGSYGQDCARIDRILEDPHGWMESTPLMKALVAADEVWERRTQSEYS